MSEGRMVARTTFNIQHLPEKNDVFLGSPCKSKSQQEQFEYIKIIFNSYDPRKFLLGPEEIQGLQPDELLLVYEDPVKGKSSQKYKLDTPFVSKAGSHIFKVPTQYYARIRIDKAPFLLQEGMHVIHHADLQFEGLISVNEPYIQFESIHVLTVPEGYEAKMSKRGVQQFHLAARAKPYVFVDTELQYHGMQELTQEVEEFVEEDERASSSHNNQALFNSAFMVRENHFGALGSNPSGIFGRKKALEKVRFDNDKQDNANQNQGGQLINPTVKDGAAFVAVSGEVSQQTTKIKLIS